MATVAVRVVDWPKTDGLTELVRVVVVLSTTTSVPVPVALFPLQAVPVPAACTVKLVDTGGVALVVLMVSVDVWSAPILATELGLNEAVAPVGKTVVTLRFAVQLTLLPLNPTVMAYVAELAGATGLGD